MGKPKNRPPARVAAARKASPKKAASDADTATGTDGSAVDAAPKADASVQSPNADVSEQSEDESVAGDSLDDRASAILDSQDGADNERDRLITEETGNLQTSCSNCRTVFEVSVDLLTAADTRVRCGECMSIFDALSNLRDDSEEEEDLLFDAVGNVIERDSGDHAKTDDPRSTDVTSADSGNVAQTSAEQAPREEGQSKSNLSDAGAAALAGLANDTGSDTGSLDVTYSDFDLFSADAGLPEVAYFDQTRESAEFDFDAVDENDETFSDTLFAQDATVDAPGQRGQKPGEQPDPSKLELGSDIDFVSDDTQAEPLMFRYQDRDEPQTILQKGSAATAELVVHPNLKTDTSKSTDSMAVPKVADNPWPVRMLLLVCVLLIAGGLYAYRERDVLLTQPLLRQVCGFIGCNLPDAENLAALRILNRSVFSHPTVANALIINVSFVNEAPFAQRYPVLDVRLTDLNGTLVVSNSIEPTQYYDGWEPGDKLDSGKRLDISLTVEDPGQRATSFELDFR